MLKKITYYHLANITAPKIDTEVLWNLSMVFVGLAVVYFISVFVVRNKISATASITKQRKRELSAMISEFLFYDDSDDVTEKSSYISSKLEIRELLKTPFNRKVLVEILLDLRKDVSGDTQTRLFELYQNLELEKDAFEKLQSWRWEVISKGILELTQMQVESAYGFITKFINHKNSTIRKQAEIATVTLKPEGINYFLDTTRYKISEWQQLKLLDVIRNQEGFVPPKFRVWLTSKNKHVVLFTLRLIKYYNQNDANASLIELVKHKNQQIQEEAIACIKEFYVVEAIPVLKSVFKKCATDTKIAILGTIAELGSTDDIDFLRMVEQKESNFSVSSKALTAINTISPESVMPTKDIEKTESYKEPVTEVTPTLSVEEIPQTMEVDEIPFQDDAKDGVSPIENQVEGISPTMPAQASEIAEEGVDAPENIQMEEPIPTRFPKVSLNGGEEDQTILSIEVIDALTLPYPEKKEASTEIDDEEESLDYDFLPIVVPPTTDINPPIKNTSMSDSKKTKEKLHHMEVQFEEVAFNKPQEEPSETETPQFDISQIDFLPLVVEGDTTEITPDAENNALKKEINEFGFLPIVTDNESEAADDIAAQADEGAQKIESLEGYTLSDFEVNFEHPENLTPFLNETPKQTFPEAEPDPIATESEDVMTWLLTLNELREMEVDYEVVSPKKDEKPFTDLIPEPVYYDAHEAYMMGLLDDLEEMGDHREVPLLRELLAEESESFIKHRIRGLIDQFSYTKNLNRTKAKEEDRAVQLPSFSIFADLFKNIDQESKLVLLGEIVSVGDEKEIDFLDGLLEDPDPKIRKKAQHALKLLIEKVSKKSEFEKPAAPKPVEELPIDLSSLEPIAPTATTKAKPRSHTPPIATETPKLLDFEFELADTEVLDKKYDEKTLNIEVNESEVVSGEGSFFDSIIEFPKKIIGKLHG
ncbi:hypothetical protein B4Q04_08620 [Zobellia sp. OII3]|uniref:HEAT repeat domain-containing protein n=1 Tax=Zobellia sp. OII3 TaxID=2034520 RepID=UPI000B537D20|nr:HEAT repeat domain-containing protein [Zobellia sp. OII3]OWW25660.1 hypothetical protein B4Q04_08620 [Zobellia sp. OII3]